MDDIDRRPFTIAGLHWIAWVFLFFSLADVVWFVVNANFSATPAGADYIVYVFQAVPAVAAILFPVALLAPQPNATTRAPTLLLGTILFALVQGMLILVDPLASIFARITPASADVPFAVVAEVYNALILAMAALGLGLIGRGLSLARRYEDRRVPVLDWFVPVATVFATVVGIVAASRLDLGSGPLSPLTVVYVAVNVILGIARVAIWAYLMTTAVRGLLAGEDPQGGWRLAALAGAIVLFGLVLINLAGVLDVSDQGLIEIYGWIVVLSFALGHLFLLTGFVLGLPSLDLDDADFDDELDEDEADPDDAFDDDTGYGDGAVYDEELLEDRLR